jgi:hypothetical protein
LLWKILYNVVLKYKKENPGWIFLRLEDLASDPINQFATLFGALGLEYTNSLKRRIAEYSKESNPDCSYGMQKSIKLNSKKSIFQWKKELSLQEIKRIRHIRNKKDPSYRWRHVEIILSGSNMGNLIFYFTSQMNFTGIE